MITLVSSPKQYLPKDMQHSVDKKSCNALYLHYFRSAARLYPHFRVVSISSSIFRKETDKIFAWGFSNDHGGFFSKHTFYSVAHRTTFPMMISTTPFGFAFCLPVLL